MKLTKYCSIVLSVLSDGLSFNRQINANEQFVRLRYHSGPPAKNIVSVRCIKECSLEKILMFNRFHPGMMKKQLTRRFYIKRMRS